MKKHAKKSLWIPILALVSVIAIAASCYLAQTFNAFAEEEVDAAAVEAPVPNPSLGTMATIHLSTGDMFSGRVGNNPRDLDEPYFAWSGEKDMYYPFDVEDFRIYSHMRSGLDGDMQSYGDVIIEPRPAHEQADRADGNIRVCTIDLSYTFYEYAGATVNYRVFDNTWDITINVTPKYYIGFNANGGKFTDGDYIKWIAQGEYNDIRLPEIYAVGPEQEGKYFAGWYTDPFWGTRVGEGTQAPGWGEITMLYAHWVDLDEPITLSYTAGGLGQMFKYELYNRTSRTLLESGTTWNYTVDSDILPPNPDCFYGTELFIDDENGQIKLVSNWYDDENNRYDLFITGASGQRISGISHNGAEVNLLEYFLYGGEGDFDFPYSKHNNFTISTEWAVPSYIAVASDNGELFSYEIRGEGGKKIEFASDYLPIFVGEDEYVFYSYGAYPLPLYPIGFNASEYEQGNGPALTICVMNFAEPEWTTYVFKDNLVSILDWFDLNTHILGVDVDGEAVPMGNHVYKLPAGWHTFGLEMTDEDLNTTVTYNANGGKFADDSDTITLDAEYGKALPVVDNPVAIDNQFIGWFTEPEGGVQVDPANYSWQPWELWYGAKLYAHWALNPQPVPPEPVPPTPDPVNPDVPGGGGAQTGDSMPLVPIAVLAVIAALGCGLAIRKEYF